MSNGLGWVDKGPRDVQPYRKYYRKGQNYSFDTVFNGFPAAGEVFPSNLRSYIVDAEQNPATGRIGHRFSEQPLRLGYSRPRAEEPYLNALREFFGDLIDRLEPTRKGHNVERDKEHLHSIMHDGRPIAAIARDMGVDESAVRDARKRAIEHLLGEGGKAQLAKDLRWTLAVLGCADRLPGWVH